MKKNYPLPSVVVNTNDNKRQRFFNSFPKNVVQGCPKLLSEIARQQKTTKTTILFIPT